MSTTAILDRSVEAARTSGDLGKRREEVWEGVSFMPPFANTMRSRLRDGLLYFMRMHWETAGKGRVYSEVNLTSLEWESNWTKNYRGPDMMLLSPDRYAMDKGEYVVGPPLVVVEVLSMGDRSYEKLGFYSDLGVPETWFINRMSRYVEIFRLMQGGYENQRLDADGWLRSAATGVEMRQTDDGLLRVRINGDDSTIADMP